MKIVLLNKKETQKQMRHIHFWLLDATRNILSELPSLANICSRCVKWTHVLDSQILILLLRIDATTNRLVRNTHWPEHLPYKRGLSQTICLTDTKSDVLYLHSSLFKPKTSILSTQRKQAPALAGLPPPLLSHVVGYVARSKQS